MSVYANNVPDPPEGRHIPSNDYKGFPDPRGGVNPAYNVQSFPAPAAPPYDIPLITRAPGVTNTSSNTNEFSNIKFGMHQLGVLVKVIQIVFGMISFGLCIGMTAPGVGGFSYAKSTEETTYFELASFCILVPTILLLISTMFQPQYQHKTMFEMMLGLLGFLMYSSASIALLIKVSKVTYYFRLAHDAFIAAGAIGLLNAFWYMVSCILTFRTIRGA